MEVTADPARVSDNKMIMWINPDSATEPSELSVLL